MGSKVQAELGNAAEESLTIAPCLQHCPGLGFPIMAVPECVFFSPLLFRDIFGFSSYEKSAILEAGMITTESPSPLPKGYSRLFSLLKLQQTGEKY